jgi:hypothetical protein
LATGAPSSSRPISNATTNFSQSELPTFYHNQKQHQAQYSPLRTSAYTPKNPYAPVTPSSPTYSDQTESTVFGYSATLPNSSLKSPSPALPLPPPIPERPPIPARPVPTGAIEIYTLNSFDDSMVSTPMQAKEQPLPRVTPIQAPQFRGEEHAKFQSQLDLTHSQPSGQHPYQVQPQQSSQGVILDRPMVGLHRHSTPTMSEEEGEIQGPRHPSIDGYNDFHGTWLGNDREGRRRYTAPHAVRDVPVETYRDYKVEAHW